MTIENFIQMQYKQYLRIKNKQVRRKITTTIGEIDEFFDPGHETAN